jgi:hypothetical protein
VALRDVGDGGLEVAFRGESREIVPQRAVATTEVYEGMPDGEALPEGHEPLNIVTFAEAEGRTTLTILVQTTTKELRDVIPNSGMKTGMQEQMDVLDQILISLR